MLPYKRRIRVKGAVEYIHHSFLCTVPHTGKKGAGNLLVGSSAHQSLLPYILHRSTLILDIPLSVPPTRSVSSRARPYCLLFPKIFLPWKFKLFPAIDGRFVGLSFASRSLLLGCFPVTRSFLLFFTFVTSCMLHPNSPFGRSIPLSLARYFFFFR